MSTIGNYTKDPHATLDYSIDWSRWVPSGDSISGTPAWSVTGPDASLAVAGVPAPSVASGIATAWLTGGTAGQTYRVTCRVTTTAGRIDDRSITVRVAER